MFLHFLTVKQHWRYFHCCTCSNVYFLFSHCSKITSIHSTLVLLALTFLLRNVFLVIFVFLSLTVKKRALRILLVLYACNTTTRLTNRALFRYFRLSFSPLLISRLICPSVCPPGPSRSYPLGQPASQPVTASCRDEKKGAHLQILVDLSCCMSTW